MKQTSSFTIELKTFEIPPSVRKNKPNIQFTAKPSHFILTLQFVPAVAENITLKVIE